MIMGELCIIMLMLISSCVYDNADLNNCYFLSIQATVNHKSFLLHLSHNHNADFNFNSRQYQKSCQLYFSQIHCSCHDKILGGHIQV
jgi:hypothetical protein